MEHGKSKFLLSFSLAICLMFLLSPTNAENKTEPRRNANLSPFESWRSAYFCIMNNHSEACAQHNTLTFNGTVFVNQNEIVDYCIGGCAQHTLDVIRCVRDVKPHGFTFETGASLSFVQNAIQTACIQHTALNTSYTKPNGATSLHGRLYKPIVSALTTLAFISTFNM
ncbi:hypothetical protein HN51_000564 [Arachis hypogaea]